MTEELSEEQFVEEIMKQTGGLTRIFSAELVNEFKEIIRKSKPLMDAAVKVSGDAELCMKISTVYFDHELRKHPLFKDLF
jgi:hypothetical protein